MALSLSNTFSLYPPPLSPSPSKPSKILALHSDHHHHQPRVFTKPILQFSLSTSSPVSNHSKRPLGSSLTVRSSPQSDDGAETRLNDVKIESEADEIHSSNLKSLMKVYKEAILYGDKSSITDVEAMICVVENDKKELFQKVSALKAEINSGKEKFIRLQADFDNFRKRSEKERLTVRSDAQGEVIESLLPMVDNFERAKQQMKLETEKEKQIHASYQGIYKQFVETLRSLNVAAVATVGKPFDPLLHEAIAREESQVFKEGMIIKEFRRGFSLGGRVLRPATVKVSVGAGKKGPPAAADKSTEQPATAARVDKR